jgi:hypothetical protein
MLHSCLEDKCDVNGQLRKEEERKKKERKKELVLQQKDRVINFSS